MFQRFYDGMKTIGKVVGRVTKGRIPMGACLGIQASRTNTNICRVKTIGSSCANGKLTQQPNADWG